MKTVRLRILLELTNFWFLYSQKMFARTQTPAPPKNRKHPELAKHFWKSAKIQKHGARFAVR
jgi:hypothetical protein